MAHSDERLEIRSFPAQDETFRSDVQAAIARSRERALRGRHLVVAVGDELRARYPAVEIREQNPLASLDQHVLRLYVYRDGRVA